MGLSFNVSKRYSIPFLLNRVHIIFTYSVNGINLFVSSYSIVDLGITFKQSLTFQPHVQRTTCKALKMIRFVKRSCSKFKFFDSIKTLLPFCLINSRVWFYIYRFNVSSCGKGWIPNTMCTE